MSFGGDRRGLVFAILLLASLVAMCAAGATKPNIILCMSDDQGWGDVSYNGLKQIQTPNLDAMAAAGLRFNRFYAQQSCSPARASVMTGRHPNRMGVFWPGMPLRKQEITVAQAAKHAGYVTGHFGKWHLNGVAGPGKVMPDSDPLSPRNCGFDESFSVSNYFETNSIFGRNGIPEQTSGDGSDVIVGEALKFIRSHAAKKQPFLSVIWFGSPHAPHRPLPADLQAAGGSAYFGEIAAMDRSMGTLRAGLRQLGIADNTLVWFCSDNGGWQDPKNPDANGVTGGLRGRKGDMYEGGIRVPCVIEWPARITRPVVSDIPAGVVDIYPTLVEIMEVKVPKQVEPLDGISLVPLMAGQMEMRPKPMGFWQGYGGNITGPAAWSDNRYKLVKLGDKTNELYNLTVDPMEQTNLAAQHPEIVNRMKAELETWQQSVLRSFRGSDYPTNQPASNGHQAKPASDKARSESFSAGPSGKGPLKVFILAGQSNMDGNANVSTIDFLGEDKEHGALLKKFKPDGKTMVTRDDVWIAHRGVYGKLGPGYGARKSDDKLGNCIGPEYAFGYFMGEAVAEQVLLIKYSVGGQSLYQNFRPPSAGLPDPLPAKTKAEDFGNQYRGLIAYVHETLDNLKKHFPNYDEKAGYEMLGFVWFQGYNDQFDERARKEYGTNLVHLIKDLRAEFKAPNMKVVVGVMGVNGVQNEVGKQKEVRDGQRFVNTVPEFNGNVKAIETAPLLHPEIVAIKTAGWLNKDRDLKKQPITPEEQAMLNRATSNQGYHYYGEGRFFILLGRAMAEAMQEMIQPPTTSK